MGGKRVLFGRRRMRQSRGLGLKSLLANWFSFAGSQLPQIGFGTLLWGSSEGS